MKKTGDLLPEEASSRELVGFLIGVLFEGTFPKKKKGEIVERALAELRRRKLGIKGITVLAGEVATRSIIEQLPLSSSELADALTFAPSLAEVAWSRLKSGEIDYPLAQAIMARSHLMDVRLRDRVRNHLSPVLKKATAVVAA